MVYIPTQEQISDIPAFNSFFRAPRDSYILVSQIANSARKNSGYEGDRTYIWKTIRAIAASPWNQSHIQYSDNGYENYNIEGPQYSKRYSIEPLAQPGSGNEYPVLWIPDPDNPLDPGAIFEPQIMPIPGGDEITYTPEEYQTDLETEPIVMDEIHIEGEREIPLEIIEEIVDPEREKIVIEPLTDDAMQAALDVDQIVTESEAETIEAAADLASEASAILEDPYANAEMKKQAIETIAELAKESGIPPEEIDAEKDTALAILDAQEAEKTGPGATPIISAVDPIVKQKGGLEAVGLSFLVAAIVDRA